MAAEIVYQPIGVYHSELAANEPYQVPRQADDSDRKGFVELSAGQQFEKALQDLSGFTRIWLIYQFHENQNWKPLVLPPRGTDSKKGVFATRAPYRPNSIGLSCVRLEKILGLKLVVLGADLLNGTPILDIKPYIPEADSFPDSTVGWLEQVEKKRYTVTWSENIQSVVKWLIKHNLKDMIDFVNRQLEYEPLDDRRKRVSQAADPGNDKNQWILAYRTWRISFSVEAEQISILRLASGYSPKDLSNQDDPYSDKSLHREFLKLFGKPS